jgi:hypothetical protein
MVVAEQLAEGRVPRQSLSSMCRDGNHKTCRDLKMRCACECHNPQDAQPVRITPAAAQVNRARTRVKTRTAEPEPKVLPVGNKVPVIQLVKADPPPKPNPPRVTLAEQVRPLLEEILVMQDRDWYRVVLFFKARQASMNLKRLRDAHSRGLWQWEARQLPEVDQSAIYVRWIGNGT